jgi:hypothetical protein
VIFRRVLPEVSTRNHRNAGCIEEQTKAVAGPRNHLDRTRRFRHGGSVRVWAAQFHHARNLSDQLDLEAAVDRAQHDALDQAAQDLKRFAARLNTRNYQLNLAFNDADLRKPKHDEIMHWLAAWVRRPENARQFVGRQHKHRRTIKQHALDDASQGRCHTKLTDARKCYKDLDVSCCCRGGLPLPQGLGSEGAKRAPGNQMTLNVEGVVDGCVDREKALRGSS